MSTLSKIWYSTSRVDYGVSRILAYVGIAVTVKLQTFHDQSSGGKGPFGTVCHIPMCPSFCERTREVLIGACKELSLEVHDKGTMVTIEGPRFSSLAESKAFRMWGCDVINMTTVPEVGFLLLILLSNLAFQ